MIRIYKLALTLILFTTSIANSQPVPASLDCPPNIGFESGSFADWACFAGSILRDGSLSLSATAPINGIL
jgi:hypothetical protein